MPANKNLMARIRVINDCLCRRTNKYWSKEALAKKILEDVDIAISTSSIIEDINKMRNSSQLGYNAPIEYSKVYGGYFYTDPEYSIDKLPLNGIDLKALKLAASTLNQYRNIPLLSAFTSTIDKVFRFSKHSDQGAVADFIDFERTPFADGLEFINIIIEAIQEKRCLEICHRKFGSVEADTYDFHPYLLKEYRNRWYVIGLNEQKQDIRTYGLDRVVSLNPSDCDYNVNKRVDVSYLADCVGINTEKNKTEKVRLRFRESQGHYLKTQKMHRSQIVLQDDKDGLIIELNVIVNFELVGIILGYGAQVTVLEPKSLAKKIVDIANETISNYPIIKH